MRADDLFNRPVWDRSGEYLGRIVDLVAEPDPAGLPRVVAVVVDKNWHGRLFGYHRPYAHRPWLLEQVTRLVYPGTRTVPWGEVRLEQPSAATP